MTLTAVDDWHQVRDREKKRTEQESENSFYSQSTFSDELVLVRREFQ